MRWTVRRATGCLGRWLVTRRRWVLGVRPEGVRSDTREKPKWYCRVRKFVVCSMPGRGWQHMISMGSGFEERKWNR